MNAYFPVEEPVPELPPPMPEEPEEPELPPMPDESDEPDEPEVPEVPEEPDEPGAAAGASEEGCALCCFRCFLVFFFAGVACSVPPELAPEVADGMPPDVPDVAPDVSGRLPGVTGAELVVPEAPVACEVPPLPAEPEPMVPDAPEVSLLDDGLAGVAALPDEPDMLPPEDDWASTTEDIDATSTNDKDRIVVFNVMSSSLGSLVEKKASSMQQLGCSACIRVQQNGQRPPRKAGWDFHNCLKRKGFLTM